MALSRSCTVAASGSPSSISPPWQAKRHQKPSPGTKLSQTQDSPSDFFEHVIRLPSDKIETKHDQVIDFCIQHNQAIWPSSPLHFVLHQFYDCQQTCRVSIYFWLNDILVAPALESLWNGATERQHRHTQTVPEVTIPTWPLEESSKEQISEMIWVESRELTKMLELHQND